MKKLDRETILQYIQKAYWSPIIKFLHENKREIYYDEILTYASHIFESEFFRELKGEGKNIEFNDLSRVLLLHHGNYYKLTKENHKTLIIDLASRSTGETAYNYAKNFPNNKVCKEIIDKYKPKEPDKIIKMNWIEIYNRTFELINNVDDASTYFSGPRFIKVLKEFVRYHPDYSQYINLRNEQGKSTSRKIYYYDILMELDEQERILFINRILEIIEPFETEKVIPIKELISGKEVDIVKKPKSENISDYNVFISYSWDDEKHKKWVLDLADKLVSEGVNIFLDRYELRAGKNLPLFIETSIKKANKIIIIYTPNYKLKAEKRKGGVGYEYSIMNASLYKDQINNEKIIPVIRKGTQTESVPDFMQQFIHIDMSNDENFETSYIDLLREIYGEPEIVKPKIGKKRKL